MLPAILEESILDAYKSLCACAPTDGRQHESAEQTRRSNSSEPDLHFNSSMLSSAGKFLGATVAFCTILFYRSERL